MAPSFNGVALNLRVDERSEVDRLHKLALSLDGRSLEMPYDAFWGSRYAVGLMSVPDRSHRGAPPDPASLG